MGYDPSNIPQEEMIESVILEIIEKTNKPRNKIPKFKCNYSSPILFDGDNKWNTKAFDLQCRQHDAKALLELLQETYVQDPKFIFHKLRHTNKKTYCNSLQDQNSYLNSSRIIPIAGVHPSIMWSLKDRIIHQFEGVIRVTGHKDSDRIGRFNVHTTDEHFENLKSALKVSIVSLVIAERSARGLNPKEFDQPPRLAFRHEGYGQGTGGYDDESTDHGGSYATYVSALNSLHTANETDELGDDTNESYTNPPSRTRPVAQAWKMVAPVQTVVTSTTTETSTRQVTNEEYERMKSENSDLKNELKELKDAFKSFVTKQEENHESAQNKMMQSMMQAMQHQMSMMMQQNFMPPQNFSPQYQYQAPPQFNMSPVNAPHQQQPMPTNLWPQHPSTPANHQHMPPNYMPLPQTPVHHNPPHQTALASQMQTTMKTRVKPL